ncbi:MAG TPA: GTP-binding protein [Xanthobacteraceae bacterium]|jgi:G3E family GTPase|nr:GTP-binding protein [Xanthobacteraceae bacterium]
MSTLDLFKSNEIGPFGRRQKRARGARIPVTVVTGFLGAGKTTLVRRFLTTPEGRNTAVVINEFGAVGIDDALVRGTTDEVALLGNGCLCCTTRSDLQLTLRRLVMERARGDVPAFERVIIETSGLADPGPILQTFSTDKALGGEFLIEVVATVIDAATGLQTLDWSAEARKQIILADRLILSKTDLVEEAKVEQLSAQLRTLNQRASIAHAIDGAIDPHCLTEPRDDVDHGFVAEADHSDGIASFVLHLDRAISWNVFARTMETLIALRGSDLLRVKGFLDVEGCQGPVLVQVVQHLAHPPVELAAWPDGDHQSRLVFITRHIAENHVRDLFNAVRTLSPQGR